MSVPRNHAFGGVVNGKIYVIGGRTGHGFILSATNTDVVEDVQPDHEPGVCRRSGCRLRAAEVRPGRRPPDYVAGGEVTTKDLVGAFRASRPTTR